MTELDYRLLGRGALRVSEVALGTMTFGSGPGWGADEDEARRIYGAFRDAGGNYVDTANQYAGGASEEIVGRLLAGHRDEVVIATKFSNSGPGHGANAGGNHRKNMVTSLEGSLRRLGVDHVDQYLVHSWDRITPVEEMMRAFDDMVRAGKVLHIGISNAPAWVVAKANTVADLRGWTCFSGLQVEYSLLARTVERDLVPMAADQDLAVLAWSPLKNGLLTGKYRDAPPAAGDGSRLGTDWFRSDLVKDVVTVDDRGHATIAEVVAVAAEVGASPAQVALAWLLARPVPVIPVLGARRAEQLVESMRCVDVELTADHLARLDAVSAVAPGYPHDYLASDMARTFSTGGLADRLVE